MTNSSRIIFRVPIITCYSRRRDADPHVLRDPGGADPVERQLGGRLEVAGVRPLPRQPRHRLPVDGEHPLEQLPALVHEMDGDLETIILHFPSCNFRCF